MKLEIEVTYRLNNRRRTKRYKNVENARRSIYQWLKKNANELDASASYFAPNGEHQRFEHYEQLNEFVVQANPNFYSTQKWRELRYLALTKYEQKCTLCGRTPEKHGVSIHVDHILPRSKYPHLALEINNLQILCDDCNLGKKDK